MQILHDKCFLIKRYIRKQRYIIVMIKKMYLQLSKIKENNINIKYIHSNTFTKTNDST